MNHLVLTPKISEKAIGLAELGIFVFEVPSRTNKIEIAKAVEAAFKVKVADVNIVIAKGKLKRYRQVFGRQTDTKKAYVKLKSGKIELFEGAK